MRNILFASVALIALGLILSCGDSTRITPSTTSTNLLTFIRELGGSGGSAARSHAIEFAAHHHQNLASKMHTGYSLTPFSTDMGPGTDSVVQIKNDGTGEKVLVNQGGWFYGVQLTQNGKMGVAAAEDYSGWIQIYSVDMATLNPTQLTTDAEHHVFPQMSADGKKVIFVKYSTDVEMGQAVIMNSSGGAETVISTPGIDVNFPSFTPDGKQIVFEEEALDTIDIMNVDGTGVKVLTNAGGTAYFDEMPSVSPDGKTIAFSRYGKDAPTPSGGEDIYTIAMDGTNLKQLTTDGLSWDPLFVNKKIAFASGRDSTTTWLGWEIYSMNLDGTGQKRLTNNQVNDYFIYD